MKKPSDIFMTHAVTITGFDCAACSFNNDAVESLCLQIKPWYCPSAEWIRTFRQQYCYPAHAFAITRWGTCYLTVETPGLKIDELQRFASELIEVVALVNSQMGGESILESVPVTACGLPFRQDMSALLAAVTWQ